MIKNQAEFFIENKISNPKIYNEQFIEADPWWTNGWLAEDQRCLYGSIYL
jgi:hypothetical protein